MPDTFEERYGYGIYAIANAKTGLVYVGQTSYRFSERWATHKRSLRKGYHHCFLLQADWNKYGEDAFEFRILEFLSLKSVTEDYLAAERKHMDRYDGRLYNSHLWK